MGLIRLVIFALVIWMFWRLIKNYQAKSQQANKPGKRNRIAGNNIVACQQCKVHVPEQDALRHDQDDTTLWFCSDAHKDKYLADKR